MVGGRGDGSVALRPAGPRRAEGGPPLPRLGGITSTVSSVGTDASVPSVPAAPRGHRLPDGWAVVLDPGVLRLDGGRTLVGGSPPRVLHLSATARRRLSDGRVVVDDATSAALARLLSDAGVAHPDPATAAAHAPDASAVSVVVPVRDRTDELARLLAAVRTTAPGIGEVVVVDDGSAVPLDVPGARVVRHERSRGPAAARNTGAAAARGELVAFLDSDVVPEPGWLTPLLAHLGDDAVALAAPRIVAWGSGRGVVGRYERRRSSLDLGARPAPVTARSRVAYVPSAAILVRRSALGAGFREDMPVAEDVDLVWRLAGAGWRLRYEPAAHVAHEHRDAVGPWLTRKAFYGTGAAPLALHHPRRVPPVALAPWTAATVVLVGVQRRWSLAAAGAVTAVATARLARGLRRPARERQRRHSADTDRPYRAVDHARLVDHLRPVVLAAVLAPWGLGGATWQAAGALTRHWWPLAVIAAVPSRRVRRVLLLAAVAEGLADWARFREPGTGPLDAAGHVLAHRADDLAYGAGLWWGALRRRTLAPLLPDLSGKGPDA